MSVTAKVVAHSHKSIERIDKLINYWEAQKLEVEMRALVFEQEIHRLREERLFLELLTHTESMKETLHDAANQIEEMLDNKDTVAADAPAPES